MKLILDIGPLLIKSVGIRYYTINLVRNILKLNVGGEVLLFPFLTEKTKKPFEGLNYKGFVINEQYQKWLFAILSSLGGGTFVSKLFLNDWDLFWTPGTFPLPIRTGVVGTIYDLTTIIFPQFHKKKMVKHQEKMFNYLKKNASLIIAISENTKSDIIKYLRIPEDKIRTIYCGVGDEFRKIEDSRHLKNKLKGIGVDYPYLFYLGTLEPRKNVERLIEAFIRLKKEKRINEKLVVSGMQGWGYQHVFNKVASSNIGKEIVFTGFVPNEFLPFLFNGASAFIYPSLYEGFGLPVLEAMACGVPVVTTNVSSLPEVAGDAAVLLNPYSVDELADGIWRILSNEDLRDGCIKKGIERARSFTWERCAIETLKVFSEVYDGNVSRPRSI
jgi:glycosyltransferase involved in cell wall biosynthesis